MELQNKHCVPCEGGAAALPKEEANRLLREIPDWRLNETATKISKENAVEFDKKDQRIVEKIVKNEMETVVDWDVPLKVATRVGANWGEITK